MYQFAAAQQTSTAKLPAFFQYNSEDRGLPWKILQFILILSDFIDPLVWFRNKLVFNNVILFVRKFMMTGDTLDVQCFQCPRVRNTIEHFAIIYPCFAKTSFFLLESSNNHSFDKYLVFIFVRSLLASFLFAWQQYFLLQ